MSSFLRRFTVYLFSIRFFNCFLLPSSKKVTAESSKKVVEIQVDRSQEKYVYLLITVGLLITDWLFIKQMVSLRSHSVRLSLVHDHPPLPREYTVIRSYRTSYHTHLSSDWRYSRVPASFPLHVIADVFLCHIWETALHLPHLQSHASPRELIFGLWSPDSGTLRWSLIFSSRNIRELTNRNRPTIDESMGSRIKGRKWGIGLWTVDDLWSRSVQMRANRPSLLHSHPLGNDRLRYSLTEEQRLFRGSKRPE